MADEVPVSDVLTDAMEYLCKLGSNLRTRSESLKQKRVSKGKLKNAHAVQKAANKVLMICELSKKSLENVELGVRRVLSIVSKAQRNKGGSDISPNPKPLHPSYQYFRHGVHKLRISKQVPIAHYLSAKVKSHRMSMSELTIYPVYYSCKLYKHRKKETESTGDNKNIGIDSLGPIGIAPEEDKENYSKTNVKSNLNESDRLATKSLTMQDSDQISPEDVIQSNNKLGKQIHTDEDMENITSDSTEEKLTNKDSNNEMKTSVNDQLCNTQCIEESTSGIGSSNKNTIHIDNLLPLSKDNDQENRSIALKESKKSESDTQNTEDRDREKGSSDSDSNKTSSKNVLSREVESEKSNKYETNNDQEEIDEIVKASNKTIERCKKDKKYKSLKCKSRVSAKDVEYGKGKSHESCLSKDKHSKSESVPEPELNKTKSPGKVNSKEHKTHHKRFKKIAILDDSDSDTPDKDANVLDGTSKEKDNVGKDREINDSVKMGSDVEDQLLALPRTEKNCVMSSIYSDSEDHSQDSKKTKEVQSVKTSDDNADSKLDSKKPIIKCVSLNKLLKPEIVSTESKVESKVDKRAASKRRKSHEISKNKENDTNHNKRIKEKHVQFREDDDDWEQKRKEVKAFKPKNCTVNINRLPKFTYVFLQTNNIKKINQEGNIVFGVQECEKVDSGLVENIKHALLNDSDSSSEVRRSIDNIQHSPQSVYKVNKSKQALLDDSDPQAADTIVQKSDETKKCDDVINSCEKTDRPISPFKDETQDSSIKSRSQNNSPANNLQSTPPSKKRDKSTTPQSKRKHIMESMHAKKMLLTYSSSSDTDDEQLRNALKEIKDDLLKCSNSSDEETKESVKELQSSSDSDEDILNRLRKKKKSDIRKLDESDEENKTTDKLQEKHTSDNADEDSGMSAKHKRESSQEQSSSSSKKVRLV